MKCKVILSGVLFFIFFLLGGCTEQQQLHQKLIVQGIGIDISNNNTYNLTIQGLDFQNPVDKDEPTLKIIETQGKTIMEALDNISNITSLTPVYSQNLILILGKKAAEFGVNNFIDFFIRHCETRPKVKICVSNNVTDILNIKPSEKSLKSKNLNDLIPMHLNSDILNFVSNLKNKNSDPWSAWIETKDTDKNKQIYLKGVGIYKDDKLDTLLENDNAFGFMILKGVPSFGSCIINSEETGDVTCSIDSSSSKVEVKMDNNNKPIFFINLSIKASTFSLDKNFYTYNIEEINKIIEEKLSEKIGNICYEVIKKTLELNIDTFEFSKILKNSNPKYFKSIEKDWKSNLPSLNFEISKNIKLQVTGKEPV